MNCCVIQTDSWARFLFQTTTLSPDEFESDQNQRSLEIAERSVRRKIPEDKNCSLRSVALATKHLVTNDLAWHPVSNTSDKKAPDDQ